MRLSSRTGVAAFAAASISVVLAVAVVTNQYERSLRGRVDQQLEERAESAPILVAVGERIAISELNPAVDGARVLADGQTTEIGRLPAGGLPPITAPGWATAYADGEDWRLYTLEVDDVPTAGDTALIQLTAPLGDVDARARNLRRRTAFAGMLAAIVAGLVGWLFGRRAARPLTNLRDDAAALGSLPANEWTVRPTYGTPEVDDVATTLNVTFDELGRAIRRREEALTSARAFAASATHELRTPLQGALTSLDVAMLDPRSAGAADAVESARHDIQRMGSSLTALGALAEADLADPAWFEPVDVVELVDSSVANAMRGSPASVRQVGLDSLPAVVWPDGVRLAVENLIRNAQTHGRRADGAPGTIVVTVSDGPVRISVDDDGQGFGSPDPAALLAPFERGDTAIAGSGLGLAFVDRVARVHGGRVDFSAGALGGSRVELRLGPTPGGQPPT